MSYTHRNGEYGTPTEDGCYWFTGTLLLGFDRVEYRVPTVVLIIDGEIYAPGYQFTCPYDLADGQWWGALKPPTENEP